MRTIMPALRGLLQQLDQYLHRRHLLVPGQRLLIACSGGADSVALLRLLHGINQSNYWGWDLRVGHVEHGVRGRASRGDAAFVRKLAAKLKLRYCEKRLIWPTQGAGKRYLDEATLRTARLHALGVLARRSHATVVLAHHADDQAETVLMRILRGAGVRGLGGMEGGGQWQNLSVPPREASKRGGKGRTRKSEGTTGWVRPLLPFTRAQLRDYLAAIGQAWREDASNLSTDYLRNRVRQELLPLLETYQPAIRDVLTRLATQAREANQTLTQIRQKLVRHARKQNWIKRDRGKLRVHRRLWATHGEGEEVSRAISGALLQEWLVELGCGVDRIDATQLQSALDAIETWRTGTHVEFAGGVQMDVRREELLLSQRVTRVSRPPSDSCGTRTRQTMRAGGTPALPKGGHRR